MEEPKPEKPVKLKWRNEIRTLRNVFAKQGWENSYEVNVHREHANTPDEAARTLVGFLRFHNVEVNERTKFLEVGSGNGDVFKVLKDNGADIVAVDARPRGEEHNMLVGARAEALPFRDGTFDIVIAHMLFDRTVYRQGWFGGKQPQMMSEIARVLRSGGVLCDFPANRIQKAAPENFGLALIPESVEADWFKLYRKE